MRSSLAEDSMIFLSRNSRLSCSCSSRGTIASVTLTGDWRKSGLQMLIIGLGAAALGFVIGRLLQAVGG